MADKPAADFTEHPLAERTVYEGGLLTVRHDTVRLADGREVWREFVVHPGAVMVVPLLDDGSVLMVRQYRYPLRRHFLELPAGKLDPGEHPLACARRELLEETGYVAAHWRHLATTHPCVGYSDETIELYLARGLSHEGHEGEDGEFLEVHRLPVEQGLAWVREGGITESKTILGLFWADRILRGLG